MAADFCRLATAALLLGWRAQLSSCACVVKGTLCRPGSYKSETGQLKRRRGQDFKATGCIAAFGSLRLDRVSEVWPG